MSFKLLGIKILLGCSTSIRKVLREGETYLLTDEYRECDNEKTLEPCLDAPKSNAVAELYNVSGAGGRKINVTISAIVGKNGDGKSTIVEVMLRLVNNFAYSFGYTNDQPTLKNIDGLEAILYYEVDSIVYSIFCSGGKTMWFKGQEEIVLSGTTPLSTKKNLKATHSKELFYSLVINYSLYAYNSTFLQKETRGKGSWIDELFHKNDSYQTPVVLNPMREDGNIDVNREEYLSRQRLISIFTTVDKNLSVREKKESRRISDTDLAVGYTFKLEDESKLINKSMKEYFELSKNYFYDLDSLKVSVNKKEPVPEDVIDRFCVFLTTAFPGARVFPISKELYKISQVVNEDRNSRETTDLSAITSSVLNTLYTNNLQKKYDIGLIKRFRNWNKHKLSYAQFYRLVLINEVWKELTKDDRFYMKGAELDQTLLHRHDDSRKAAMLYVLYKVISIIEKYPSLTNYTPLTDEKFSIIMNPWPNIELQSCIAKDVNEIYKTHDYRTLKLFQTIKYLKREKDDWYGSSEDIPSGIEDYDHFIDFDTLKSAINTTNPKEAMEYLPSPIFVGDIVLKSQKTCYTMDKLSSGMIQRLNSVGSFVYHLRNLDDEQKAKDLVNYQNIVVVFEEVELYFHPEYQKSYLNFLLKQIERSNLQKIENIHIIFVTHSPFILSDVLKGNILCLNDGVMEDKTGFDTFGANIHNLLRMPFFMRSGTVGDFAQMTIDRVVSAFNIHEWNLNKSNYEKHMQFKEIKEDLTCLGYNSDKFDYKEFCMVYSKTYLYDIISLLDEPLVGHSLMDKWYKLFSPKTEKEKRIEYLEAELRKLKESSKNKES